MVDRVVVQLPRFVRVASVSSYFGDMAIWQYDEDGQWQLVEW